MSLFAWSIIITLIAGVGGTGIGGLVGALFKKDNPKIVSLLLSFAGGVMMAVVCFDLVPEAIMDNVPKYIFIVLGSLLLGFVLVFLLNIVVDKISNREVRHIDTDHPKTADSPDELIHSDHYVFHLKTGGNKLFRAGLVMAFAIALHNFPEGMVIGASVMNSGSATAGSALALAIVIGLHNIPEGMGISVPLIAGGAKKWKAVLITASCGLPTVLGAMLGAALGALGEIWLSISLGFASGAMLYVVLGELLPEAFLMYKSKLPAVGVFVGICVGILVIFL